MKLLKNWDNKTWLTSKNYINKFHSFLKLKLNLKKTSKILDIGCGRAYIIGFLQSKYKFNNKPIGIDVVKNKDIKKNIVFKKIDAIKYLKKTDNSFDLILIKQTIHFFKENKIKLMLDLAKNKLNKNGRILIFFLKTNKNQIPCFKLMKSELMQSLKNDQNLVKIIKKNLKKNKTSYFSFKVNLARSKYIKMIKNRYISCLLNISDNEIEKGVNEIKIYYKKQIKFTDTLNCISYRK